MENDITLCVIVTTARFRKICVCMNLEANLVYYVKPRNSVLSIMRLVAHASGRRFKDGVEPRLLDDMLNVLVN